MSEVGLRELRQDASGLVRRVQDGEELTVTVSGRPAARLVPAQPRRWRRFDEVSELFAGPGDPSLLRQRELLDDELRDPWGGR